MTSPALQHNKDFRNQIVFFKEQLEYEIPFALVRVSDAESYVLDNRQENVYKPEHNYNWLYKDDRHQYSRSLLLEATSYASEGYYIGLPTHGDKTFFDRMKSYTTCDPRYLTHATLFMDGNYQYFANELVPLFKHYSNPPYRNVVGVFNKDATIPTDLNITKVFNVHHTAFVNDLELIDEMKEYIDSNKINDSLFLVTAGIFSNILIHNLWMHNNSNTYIDIGSALDYKLGLGHTRSFFDPNHPSAKKMFPWYD